MNRVIKFRAWDGNRMRGIEKNDRFSVRSDGMLSFGQQDDGAVLMQFTGLCDKNGKEIYEGDVLRYEPSWIRIFEKPRVVEFHDSGYAPFQYDGGGEWSACDCVVIGNIYENPDILQNQCAADAKVPE